jgi:hypothetical protein
MLIKYQRIYLFSSLISLSISVQGDSWDVIQSVNISSNLNMQQINSNNSQQAINVINTDTAMVHSQQQLGLMGNSVSLYQINGSNNQQGLNLLNANQLDNNEQAILDGDVLTLNQIEGNANIQAANFLETQGDLSANQRLLVNSINLQQYNGQDNIQAGNVAIGNTGQLTQNFSAQQINIKANSAMEASVLQAANYVNYSSQTP